MVGFEKALRGVRDLSFFLCVCVCGGGGVNFKGEGKQKKSRFDKGGNKV